jgi:hypothetical protein
MILPRGAPAAPRSTPDRPARPALVLLALASGTSKHLLPPMARFAAASQALHRVRKVQFASRDAMPPANAQPAEPSRAVARAESRQSRFMRRNFAAAPATAVQTSGTARDLLRSLVGAPPKAPTPSCHAAKLLAHNFPQASVPGLPCAQRFQPVIRKGVAADAPNHLHERRATIPPATARIPSARIPAGPA